MININYNPNNNYGFGPSDTQNAINSANPKRKGEDFDPIGDEGWRWNQEDQQEHPDQQAVKDDVIPEQEQNQSSFDLGKGMGIMGYVGDRMKENLSMYKDFTQGKDLTQDIMQMEGVLNQNFGGTQRQVKNQIGNAKYMQNKSKYNFGYKNAGWRTLDCSFYGRFCRIK